MHHHYTALGRIPAPPANGTPAQADDAPPLPNDKLRDLANNEETQFMSLVLRDKGLMASAMDAGITPSFFQNEAMHRLFALAAEHFERCDGAVLSRPALEAMMAGAGTPEEAAKVQSQYDRTVATFGVGHDDYAMLKGSIEERHSQKQAYAVCTKFADELLPAVRGQDEIVARFKRAAEAVSDGQHRRQDTLPEAKPWQRVTTADIQADIHGTRIETVAKVLASVAEPPLPLEITLPKALALVGTAMSRPKDQTWRTAFSDDDDPACGLAPKTGPEHLRFMINTAGGQACNVWAMIVAGSGIGKDIGNLPSKLAMARGWLVGSSASSEGLKDAFVQLGSGLMDVSELQPFLDKGSWQHGCTEFLTSAFNAGWFKEVLSRASKSGGHIRRSAFCYPSVMANIQPKVLQGSQGASLLFSSGFLQRFLISTVERGKVWRPRSGDIDFRPALCVLEQCETISGVAEMPQGYLQDVMDEFAEGGANESIYSRLVNEYGPRFACMLAANPPEPTADDLAKAGRMARWFYSMAERVMANIEEDPETRETNELVGKIMAFVRERKKAPWREFVQRFGRVPGRRREQVIRQMIDDGLIVINKDGRGKAIRLP